MLIQIFNLTAVGTVIDSYSETNSDGSSYTMGAAGTATAGGQAFTASSLPIGSAKFYLSKTGSPTGNAIATIYASTGTFGLTMTATGAALATSNNFDVSTLTGSLALTTFTFPTSFQPVAGTKYIIAVEYTGGDASNLINIGGDTTTLGHPGNVARKVSGTWSAQSLNDAIFYVLSAGAWETIASENRVAADVDFQLQGKITSNLSNYYDSNSVIVARVYQLVI